MDVEKRFEDILDRKPEEVHKTKDVQMTSSILSTTSSLASPVDSGVQLLDSESEITSLMSVSGIGCDSDPFASRANETGTEKGNLESEHSKDNPDIIKPLPVKNDKDKIQVMTNSDIDNHNHFDTAPLDFKSRSKSWADANISEELLELEPVVLKTKEEGDLCNISLNSYELLDYTFQHTSNNRTEEVCDGIMDDMHVSMSEEVNETLKILVPPQQPNISGTACLEEIKQLQTSNDDQIVFRRQRRKKSKSDTPKKRVSFHEDILNSTKVDDVHIDHGFITREPDFSMSFFNKGFVAKPDVVKGRYSWAAEGDTPYYKKNTYEREVKSDIYVHRPRFSSTSSSSSTSISSSIDEEDTGNSNSDDVFIKKEPTLKLPKSSCLKKTRSHKKYIDTNIVEEETSIRKRKSENNLLDTNIIGSLKSIFTFSSSVPLAERGVPEGQEDLSVYSSSERNLATDFLTPKTTEGFVEVCPAPVKKISPLELAKTNLKLTKGEGFYPNYPSNDDLPPNIILCDSNVYEHKGISYSYEYEEFQKSLEIPEKPEKPKSSRIYQMLFNELNFFKRKARKDIENEAKENFEIVNATTPTKEIHETSTPIKSANNLKKYASSATIDFSDNETLSDVNDNSHTRHLHSPKRKISKTNHYSVNSFRSDSDENEAAKPLQSMKQTSSKNSLINRFLKNVTMRKMIDLKLQKRQNSKKKYMNLYVKRSKIDLASVNKQLDAEIEKEIIEAKERSVEFKENRNKQMFARIRSEIFREYDEVLLKVYPINSAYTSAGETKPLILTLSNTTLYISGLKPNSTYCNYFVLPYTDLNTVMIGPDSHTVHFSNYNNEMQCIVTTGSPTLTSDIVGQVELAMRRDTNKPKLLAVKQLTMRDMVNLRNSICKHTSIMKDEEYYYYAIVNIQDCNADVNDMPLGPSKEGPLMFKTVATDSRWETAYFILKAGILYMLSSPSHRLPMRVLPLINGACQGARRVYQCNRPHTFQIQVGALTLHLAAPDEYVASEWLQVIVHAASKTYSHREKNPTQSCSLLMTSDHIVTVRESFPSTLTGNSDLKGAQILCCASISDITTFRLPCAEQSWCILEFSCREVHECSGDWILYFATNAELERFISTLEVIWSYNNKQGESFPVNTIPETDSLSRRCVDTHQMLQCAWASLHINLKSF